MIAIIKFLSVMGFLIVLGYFKNLQASFPFMIAFFIPDAISYFKKSFSRGLIFSIKASMIFFLLIYGTRESGMGWMMLVAVGLVIVFSLHYSIFEDNK